MNSSRLILAVILMVACIFVSPAQENPGDTTKTMEQEILSHPETDVSVLGKARAVLIEAIKGRDTAKARRVVAFMEQRFDRENVVILYPGEEILVAYWVRDYDRIFSFATRSEFEEGDSRSKIVPESDLMFDQLREESRISLLKLQDGFRRSELPSYKKDFLDLFLAYMIGPSHGSEEEQRKLQDELNLRSDEYLSTYTDSEFNGFIRRNVRYVIAASEWGFGYELGVGYLALPSNLSRHMKDFGLLSMALEASYQRAYGCLRIDIGAAHHMRQGFVYNGTWKDGLLVMHTGGLLAGGPMISLGGNFTLTPIAGVGFLDFSPPTDEKNQEGNDVSMTFAAAAVGANLDIPLGGESGTTYLRLNVGYRGAITDISLARGNYIFITLGVDFFGRSHYREL